MKGKSHFHFKQFSVAHDRCVHKVGTDAVLLGAWVNVGGARRILDAGTGSGVIALMLAQRTANDVAIDAVEIDSTDAAQATENVNASPWPEKISVHHQPIQEFQPGASYDLVVSNPPYFVNSHLPEEQRRARARHTEHLTFDLLLTTATSLMKKTSRLAVVLPPVEGEQFSTLAAAKGLYVVRRCAFRSRAHKAVERLLIEFAFQQQETVEESLTLYAEGDTWSDDYRALTADFYLRA